jgi:RNA polymerase sigma factor (sigma-70 family)
MAVPQTQHTLIARLRDPADEAAWSRFECGYRELVVRFAMRQGLQQSDAEDVAQAVFQSLLSAMQGFTLDKSKGRFRDYLFRAVRNEISRQSAKPRPKPASEGLVEVKSSGGRATPTVLDQAADFSSELEAQRHFENEWIDHHFRTAFTEIRRTFSPDSVAIFERLMAGTSVESTAEAFATTAQAVHKVKQRIRDRMQELVRQQIAEEDG